jgi:sucrose-phosphate synthase
MSVLGLQKVNRFLRNPAKPVILAMSRPDAKKNISTLVKAFGENRTLRELANLVLIMGNRSKIDGLARGSQQVLMQVLKLIDEYDLYGSVAYPKTHTQVCTHSCCHRCCLLCSVVQKLLC